MYPSLQVSARPARKAMPSSLTSRVLGSQRLQSPAFLGGQLAPLAGCQVAKLDRADGNSHQAQRGETDGRGHSPDLAVASLAKSQPEPGGGHVFAEADWHRTVGQGGSGFQQLNLGRARRSISEDNTTTQRFQGCRTGNSLHLHKVGSGVLESRVGQAMGQGTVVGEQKQPFAITIEPANRVNPGNSQMILERALPSASVNWQRTSKGLYRAR